MDKSALKAYAVEARRKLIDAVKVKARQLYIFGALLPEEATRRLQADGIFLTAEQSKARLRICNILAEHGNDVDNTAAYQRLAEDVACTWFNRFIALRIMEVNDWLPSGIRILSSHEPGRAEPDAMREVERLDYVKQVKIAELRAGNGFDASEKLYKYILISQCNALSSILPGMFEKADDYTELLLPDALLAKGGIVNDLVTKIHEDNFNLQKQGQIEIIGWLYQFYISEKKDEVFAGLKKNIKINKDTIPAATQLFTPEWIVKYMVENSLGRLWLDAHPNADLRSNWKYYIDEAEQTPEVAEQLRVLRSQSPVKRPEDIKLIDPCMGSGHILVYAFEVLYQIYQSEGYAERDIPNLILQNNLYGLDIDDRAGQLAYFALMIKARSYNRRFFRQETVPQPMVYSADGDDELSEFGSLLKVTDLGDMPVLSDQMTIDDLGYVRKLNAWNYKRLLSQRYDVVVTNPPYMGNSGMSGKLADFMRKEYPDGKSDTFSAFIERCSDFLTARGMQSMITMESWMFLSSFEKLRLKLLNAQTIVNMVHMPYLGKGGTSLGINFGTAAFVLSKQHICDYNAQYDYICYYETDDEGIPFIFPTVNERYKTATIENFAKIPGSPVAYWVSEAMLRAFIEEKLIGDIADVKIGMGTGKNEVFVREWWEVVHSLIDFSLTHVSELEDSQGRYFPYNKGGDFRLWYGNLEYVVWFDKSGRKAMDDMPGHRENGGWNHYFRQGITWSFVSSSKFGVRLSPYGFTFDVAGSTLFSNEDMTKYLLGYLSSVVCFSTLNVLNPTLNYQAGNIKSLPIIVGDKNAVDNLVEQNITHSRADWDAFETSWDFKQHPFLAFRSPEATWGDDDLKYTVEEAWFGAKAFFTANWDTLKSNEEELNRIFIDIYGLQDELTPEVEDKDVTVRRADLGREIRSLISYAVGCMFGRYSLDEPGLAFAGGTFDITKYKTYIPEDDNIIPIGSADYFDDDIVVRFTDFVRTIYGESTLGENLQYIADALYPNGNGTARDRIRRYFLNDFYKDHVKIYQKRPIYWLMDSGKKDGFKALFYLHRYDKYTVRRGDQTA